MQVNGTDHPPIDINVKPLDDRLHSVKVFMGADILWNNPIDISDQQARFTVANHVVANGVDWMTPDSLAQSILDAANGHQGTQSERPKSEPPAFVNLIDSATLAGMTERPRYLVRNILVAGQPAVIGGRSKTLKTSIAIDLFVSLASGTPFLGEFPTGDPCRVGFWSGESGLWTIRETALRIAKSRGVSLPELPIHWGFALPKLSRADHLAALKNVIVERQLGVAGIDPAYLAFLTPDNAGVASNVYAMGSLLQPIGEIGQETGCTMILLHHFKRTAQSDKDEPASLEELSQAGMVEWARQWLLLARRSPYQADGTHQLWLRAGGSAGHAGLFAVDVGEGVYDVDQEDGGRYWDVNVRASHDAQADARRERDQQKADQQAERDDEDRRRLLAALRQFPSVGETKRVLGDISGLRGERLSRAILALIQEGRAESCEVQKHTRIEAGYRATDQ